MSLCFGETCRGEGCIKPQMIVTLLRNKEVVTLLRNKDVVTLLQNKGAVTLLKIEIW